MADKTQGPPHIPEVVNALGARLRGLRRIRAMTLADLADATGITLSTLSRIEAGGRRPSLDILVRLATVYRVTLDDLVGGPATADPRLHPTPKTRYGRPGWRSPTSPAVSKPSS